MLRIYNALSIIDPLPGLGAKVLPEVKKVEDPNKAFNEGNHKPLTRLPLPPPFCKKEAKKANLAKEYASGKLEADVNKAQVALAVSNVKGLPEGYIRRLIAEAQRNARER